MLAIAQLKGEYTMLHRPANISARSSFDNSYWVLFLGEGDVNSELAHELRGNPKPTITDQQAFTKGGINRLFRGGSSGPDRVDSRRGLLLPSTD